ncbi:MAG TPA: outer membrane beta-barrel protein [Verrucomicrobiae bacterium]|nr:outer membrane beta-barrel protein [Verrucomicrobiae bacterium]
MQPSLLQGRLPIVGARKRNLKSTKSGSASAAMLCLFGAAAVAKGQSVVMPPPSYSVTPPAVQSELGGQIGEGTNPALPDFANLLQWGPVTIHPHASYQLLYADGLQSAPGQQQSSVVQTLSPGVFLNIGTHWTLDYSPTITFYSSSQLHDTVNQTMSLSWGTFYEDWSWGFSQGLNIADNPLVQTATQTSTESYNTSLTASHRFNSVMSLDMSLSQSINSADQFSSSKSWNTMEYLNYQLFPRMDAALGVGFGYDAVSLGPDMSHETVQARLSWSVANKTGLVVHGGVEDLQYLGGGVPETITPVFGVSLQYQAFSHTSISLNADRSISPALFASQAAQTTTLGVSLGQRFLQHFNFSVSGSYGLTDYLSSSAGVAAGRSDSYYSISSQLSWAFLKRATVSLTDQYSVNNSNANGFGFSSTQVGIMVGYGF